MQTKIFSIGDTYRVALDWWRNEAKYVYYLLLPALVVTILSNFVASPEAIDSLAFDISSGILFFVLQILHFILITAATASFLFFISSGQKEKWENWGKYLRVLLKYIAVNILFALMVIVGLIFLIVPGVYLAMRYAFVGYRTLEHPEESISRLFAAEAERTEGHRWAILGLFLSLLVVVGVFMSIVSVITLTLPEVLVWLTVDLVEFLFVTPIALLVGQAAYTLLNKEFGNAEESEETSKTVVKEAEVIEVGA